MRRVSVGSGTKLRSPDPAPQSAGDVRAQAPAARATSAMAVVLAAGIQSAARGNDIGRASRQQLVADVQRHLGNTIVQALLSSGGGAALGAETVARQVSNAKGAGVPMDPGARGRLERGYGTELSSVRVHADPRADLLARSVGAEAFTSGHDIFFRHGAYAPSTPAGFRLLAHEAAHVVQQASGPVPVRNVGGGLALSEPSDAGERAADRAAEQVSTSRSGDRATVQRCGPVPCGCSAEEKAEHAAGASVAVQRKLAVPAAGSVVVQRAPLAPMPLGDLQVVFDPKAKLEVTPPGQAPRAPDERDMTSETVSFTDVPRGSSGQLSMPVAIKWFGKAGPGPVSKKCDLCEALRRRLEIPGLGSILPDSLLKRCQELVNVDPAKIEEILLDIQQIALDPCGELLDVIVKLLPQPFKFIIGNGGPPLCRLGLGVPPLSTIVILIQGVVNTAVPEIRTILKNLPPECRKKPATAAEAGAPTGPLVGTASSTLQVSFFSNPDGSLQLVGLSPLATTDNKGARLDIPVEARSDVTPTGSISLQKPVIRSLSATTDTAPKLLTATINLAPPPPDANYFCAGTFAPFKVGSDQFEDDDGEIQRIRTFYFGMHPKIRQDLEEGRGLIRITGRASKTGTQKRNLTLGEKRAKRVQNILTDFAGTDARFGRKDPRFRVFSLGELGAQTKGPQLEDPKERRAEVEVSGTILQAGVLDSQCQGHENEPTPSGSTLPVHELETVVTPDQAGPPQLEQPPSALVPTGDGSVVTDLIEQPPLFDEPAIADLVAPPAADAFALQDGMGSTAAPASEEEEKAPASEEEEEEKDLLTELFT